MRSYVRDTLDRESGRYLLYSIEAEVVADGVFLWVSFAIQSLLNEMRNENEFEMFKEILQELPSEMIRLYQHMWHRLNERMGSVIVEKRASASR